MGKEGQIIRKENQIEGEHDTALRKGGLLRGNFLWANATFRVMVTLYSVLAYLVCFTILFYIAGHAMAISAVIPVIVIGWLYGCRAGVGAAVSSFPVNIFMCVVFGTNWLDTMVRLGGGGIAGTFALIFIGAIVGYVRDLSVQLQKELTDRKRADETLLKSEEKYRMHFENVLDIIYSVDSEYQIQNISPSVEKVLGYTPDELIGRPFPELNLLTEESLEKALSDITCIMEGKKIDAAEYEFLSKDGTVKIGEVSGAPLFKDNKISGVVSVGRDITERKKAEDEVREIKEYLDNIIESSLDCITVSDAQGCLTRVNKSFLALVGYEEEEVRGKTMFEFSPKGGVTYNSTTGEMIKIDKEYFDDIRTGIYSKLFEEGKISNWESYYLCKDGEIVPVEINIVLLYNKTGEVIGSVGINRDITERKKAEKKIIEARDFLENVFKTSADGIMVTSSGEASITMINEAIVSMVGYSRSELIGMHPSALAPQGKEYQERGITFVEKLHEEGFVNAFEFVWVRKDGSLIDVELNAVLLKDDKGATTGTIINVRDITERKKFESALKMSEEKYRSLIENANDAIISLDKSGKITSFNKRAEDILGYTPDEILGKPASLLAMPDNREMDKKALEKFAKKSTPGVIGETVKTHAARKDGQLIPIESSICSIEVGGECIITAIIRDISEREEMQKILLQSEKLKSLGELAGGVAHDFNNVLAAILGRAQLLKMVEKPLSDGNKRQRSAHELKEGLEIIEQAAKDGAETVRRIQEFARKGGNSENFVSVDINEVIEHALEFTRARWKDEAESKGIVIKVLKTLSPLPAVAGNASELREVFTNLINNALDAMPRGGGITIKTYKEHSFVCVRVEDTGVGIPRAIRDNIFDPFFTTKGVQSTGLGLSVSYGIINRHQGTVMVDSTEGQGTTFTITLPISKGAVEATTEKHVFGEQRKAHILVIEDEVQVRQLLSAILVKGGHEVETAADGIQGIEIFEKKAFDLVFTDLGMPVISGWQVAEKVKSINKEVPVALITGWNVDLKESEVKKSGVDLIIKKPFEINQVFRLVQEGMILRDRFRAA